jgi:hypothetical protein
LAGVVCLRVIIVVFKAGEWPALDSHFHLHVDMHAHARDKANLIGFWRRPTDRSGDRQPTRKCERSH